ncbi:hypothetical protein [Mesomycoplasma ovipneumoniae]|uniref:hypothetical protein n=1 Tax=Mesomycoplasma ovipneumoniae TaxID=29562 RepID=UPI0028AA71DE|nr:hypothetical protein [Mesomycoplasma ovipneumoniae]WNM14650.1 hypothetical protein RNM01_02785 [Mesomycoplasma ovipneumoniae]
MTNYHLDPTQESSTTLINSLSATTLDNSQSISFRLQSSAVMVTPTNVDYMNPG